jgi:hypothetical protein
MIKRLLYFVPFLQAFSFRQYRQIHKTEMDIPDVVIPLSYHQADSVKAELPNKVLL